MCLDPALCTRLRYLATHLFLESGRRKAFSLTKRSFNRSPGKGSSHLRCCIGQLLRTRTTDLWTHSMDPIIYRHETGNCRSRESGGRPSHPSCNGVTSLCQGPRNAVGVLAIVLWGSGPLYRMPHVGQPVYCKTTIECRGPASEI